MELKRFTRIALVNIFYLLGWVVYRPRGKVLNRNSFRRMELGHIFTSKKKEILT